MRTLTAILVLLAALVLVPAAHAATYYIDYASGSNANSGTDTAHPWKSAPGMQTGASCGGAIHPYSHVAGDQFIFKGGVIWPNACFQMTVATGGTSGSPDYYGGGDQTWFAGGSWTLPIWDLAQTATTGGPNVFQVPDTSGGNVTLDHIEIRNFLINTSSSGCPQDSISGAGSDGVYAGNVTVSYVYDHDWVVSLAGAPSENQGHVAGGLCLIGTADHDTLSDQNGTVIGGNPTHMGVCFSNVAAVIYSHCSYAEEGWVGAFMHTMHDSEIDHLDVTATVPPFQPRTVKHLNVVEDLGSGGVPIYNNAFHDNTTDLQVGICPSDPFYNNVMWGDQAGGFEVSLTNENGSNCTNLSTTTGYVVNNTIDCTIRGGNCITWAATFLALDIHNNHLISNQNNGPALFNNNCTYGCPGSVTPSVSGYPVMTSQTAAAQGYNVAGKYAPASGSGSTVGAGTNLTSYCAGALANLCTDASGAPWFGGSGKSRGTAWDTGAYLWQGGTTGPPTSTVTVPSAGATVSGSSVTLTSTCSTQGSATVASIQFYVDGQAFGAAGSSSPYSVTLDSTKLQNGTNNHSIYSICTDSNSQTSAPSVTITVSVSNSTPGCTTSDPRAIFSQAITNQTGTFTATWTYTVNSSSNDTDFGLSSAPATSYSSMSALLLADTSGVWKAWNNAVSGYAAVNSAPITPGTVYVFSGTFTFSAGNLVSYSISETSPSSIVIASAYTPRASATALAYWNLISDQGLYDTAKICGFQIGSTPTLSFNPASLPFGNVAVGSNSSLSVVISNTGSGTTFSNVVLAGADLTKTADTCNGQTITTLTCTVTVQFAPSMAETVSGSITFTDNATGSPQVVPITATGVASSPSISCSPPSVNLGSVRLANPAITVFAGPIVCTITNPPATFTSVATSGGNFADFGVSANSCTGTVSASTCNITASFSPSLIGSEATTLVITATGVTGSPQNVALTGVGLIPAPPVAPGNSMFVWNQQICKSMAVQFNFQGQQRTELVNPCFDVECDLTYTFGATALAGGCSAQ